MSGRINRALSQVVTKIKGSSYNIDDRIGAGYLIRVSIERALMKLRGLIRFPGRSAKPFIAAGASFRSQGDLTFGSGVTFGRSSYVDALSTEGVRLGDNTSLGRNSRIECTGNLQTIGRGLAVGNDVGLGTDSFYGCAGGITIGDNTLVGNFVSFHSENHEISDLKVPIRLQGVTHCGITIGANCWIGAKATILDGADIGEGCVVAAGSVVTGGTYPPNGIYGGIPAKLIKTRT